MSEEERKGKHKASRIISITALIIGIAAFLSGLLAVLAALWIRIIPGAGGDFDFIGMFLTRVAYFSFVCFWNSWHIAVIGLVLSIVTLFIERNRNLRLLPLAFLIVGICIYAMVYVIGFLMFLGG